MSDENPDAERVAEMRRWARAQGALARGGSQRTQPCSVVLDPEYRYPYHPGVSVVQSVETRPTDPEVLRHIGSLVDEFNEHYLRVKGHVRQSGPTYAEDELAAAERRVGIRLPEDVRALYRVAGADNYETGLLDRYSLIPLPLIHARPTTSTLNRVEDLFDSHTLVLEAYPPGRVRRVAWNDRWVEVASDGGGGLCAVDLDPAPGGCAGQLLEYGRGVDRIGVIADSATALLTDVVEALRRNDIDPDYADGNYLGVRLPRPDPQHSASLSVGDDQVAHVLGDIPDIEYLQELYLNDGDSLDLSALSVTPRLQRLSINRAKHVHLWLPDGVENLELDAQRADLSAIAGHPALWSLTVAGFRVRVEQLAALPRLVQLDASGADVDNVTALAGLDLRVLLLNSAQWTQLRSENRQPPRLAAARCTDGTPLPFQGVDWLDWVRGDNQNQLT